MTTANNPSSAPRDFELRFRSLFDGGRGLSFPCDRLGHVDIDGLTERARANYYFARSLIGRDFSTPAVLTSDMH